MNFPQEGDCLYQRKGKGIFSKGKQRSMGTNGGSNTIETRTVSSNEQFSGLQNRRGLWEFIITAWMEIYSPRERSIQFMMRFKISQR